MKQVNKIRETYPSKGEPELIAVDSAVLWEVMMDNDSTDRDAAEALLTTLIDKVPCVRVLSREQYNGGTRGITATQTVFKPYCQRTGENKLADRIALFKLTRLRQVLLCVGADTAFAEAYEAVRDTAPYCACGYKGNLGVMKLSGCKHRMCEVCCETLDWCNRCGRRFETYDGVQKVTKLDRLFREKIKEVTRDVEASASFGFNKISEMKQLRSRYDKAVWVLLDFEPRSKVSEKMLAKNVKKLKKRGEEIQETIDKKLKAYGYSD
ncbi:hypothetical protein AbHV_ORF55 [Abalone herpesvirus Victoria/AUS/2009]|uniref:Uncharacterized protein n=2 Tax=Aurivirus haliotidmalaco1 TaxID=3050290 RepID=K4JX57_ABHV|nr:hypothetical protein AbHV_ORF55 [Abalone herpesvirus Victoria/AUS/2009]ADL16673.1 AbHVp047c [Abalone herpesvirus Victoria/AUS/2007]AFU90065.1 hypothetical protein AbHV_ORF55 [Abalone herpesvirus Victoria/AUS/2009]